MNDVPLIIGSMAQETDFEPRDDLTDYSEDDYKQFIRKKLSKFDGSLATKALELYPVDSTSDPQRQYETMASDIRTKCGMLFFARDAQRSMKSSVWHYVADFKPKPPTALNEKLYGNKWKQRNAAHQNDQLWLLETFNNNISGHIYNASTGYDGRITSELQNIWANFSNTLSAPWERMTSTSDNTHVIGLPNNSSARALLSRRCRFWDENGLIGKYSWNN